MDARVRNGAEQLRTARCLTAQRSLVVVVVAFVVSVVAFALSFFPHLTLQLVSSILHFLAFLLTLIAFAIQIGA